MTLPVTYQIVSSDEHSLPEDVHLWCAHLTATGQQLTADLDLLTATESERSSRYRFEEDRRRFIERRALLRELLSLYLSVSPRDVSIDAGPHGKLLLPHVHVHRGLTFNLSCSGDLALYAIGHGSEVGVDLEQLRPIADLSTIAQQYFTRHENAAILQAVGDERALRFLRIWTAKEAFVKALGTGLSTPLVNVPIHFCTSADTAVTARHAAAYSFVPAANHIAALYVRHDETAISQLDVLARMPAKVPERLAGRLWRLNATSQGPVE